VKYSIHTFGCRVNQADSFDIEESLRARGAVPAPADEADLLVVNTCTVTGAADQGARNLIRRVARRNRSARIVVTGCYATREPDALASMAGVTHMVSNREKEAFFRSLRSRDRGGVAGPHVSEDGRDARVTATTRLDDGDGACGTPLEPGVMGRTAYPLRVQTGCEERCAFCVIPSTRGGSRSRPIAEVLAGVARLSRAGYKELWLVGVHLGSYGRDLAPPASILDLLRALDGVRGDLSFRISSLEPMDCSRQLVDLVARSRRFAPHFHLPLQHASDRVLGAMRRPYSADYYRGLVEHIHERLPHASIGTDMIVGFPGESEEEAHVSERAAASLPLSYLHVFPYSDRPGTPAAEMFPKVPPAAIKLRAARLRGIGGRLSADFIRCQVGTTRSGLTLDDGTTVLTDNFLKIAIPPGLPRNTRVRVRIDTGSPALAGRVV
jgi:threonylcarbamoyladenosine tRNA methylthiotransferase MtaB